jgi:hypothetical protein
MDTSHQLSTGTDVSMRNKSRILSTSKEDEANKSKVADDNDASTATPVATSRGPAKTSSTVHPALRVTVRQVQLRYDLKINVLPSNDAVKALHDAIILVVTKLRSIDSTLVVYPWEDENR